MTTDDHILDTVVAVMTSILVVCIVYAYFFYVPANCNKLIFGRNLYQERYEDHHERYRHLDGDDNNFICEKQIKK